MQRSARSGTELLQEEAVADPVVHILKPLAVHSDHRWCSGLNCCTTGGFQQTALLTAALLLDLDSGHWTLDTY